MRAWLTAMPGEQLGCVGCHEKGRIAPPTTMGAAFREAPSRIRPWSDELRGFGFRRDVQPILARRCVGCHDGGVQGRPDLRDIPGTSVREKKVEEARKFTQAYLTLQKYVYRPGPESAVGVLVPMEYYPENSELVQMLQKGHHGVQLTQEEWARINLWIDLNIPYLGHWLERRDRSGWNDRVIDPTPNMNRRLEYLRRYANIQEHIDAAQPYLEESSGVAFVAPAPQPAAPPAPASPPGWPMSQAEARKLQSEGRESVRRTIDMGGAPPLELVWVPAGSFIMGSRNETPDEYPQSAVTIEKGFWMSSCEVVNQWYRLYDSRHDSGQFNEMAQGQIHCENLNGNSDPVVRVSWQKAKAFCAWLTEKTGENFDLPTEAQWEWACRAGSDKAFHFGPLGIDPTGFANTADSAFGRYFDKRGLNPRLFSQNHNDRKVGSTYALRGQETAWGLMHMHGNAAEWTRSLYRPYPYKDDDGRNDPQAPGKRVVRGGSFSDRPKRCTSSYRLGYRPWQGVYNVGFRVICYPQDDEDPPRADANR
jgi:formylglycine-generating enzyme required for sulfatase activity